MKTMKLIYPLALALAVSLAGAGCKHSPTKLTRLPGSPDAPQAPITEANTTTLPSNPGLPQANPFPQADANPTIKNNTDGTIPTANPDLFENMIQDRQALANYTVHFAFDSAAVKSTEKGNLQSVATALAADSALKLLIEGHCDERGTDEYNRSLGERRALALREALAKLKLDPSRVKTVSYGKDKPVDPGHDEAAFAKNRRGEFVLLHPLPKP